MKKQLIFVYNATSGIWDKYLDTIHKIVSPKTYPCDLCSLTHGSFAEKTSWKHFKKNFPYDLVFTYKDKLVGIDLINLEEIVDFPVVLIQKEEQTKILIDSEELAVLGNTKELIRLIQKKIEVF